MPAKIIRDPITNRPVVVYRDPAPRDRPRPQGSMRRDPETGRRTALVPADPAYFVGLDLGQTADWTALAVVARDATGFTVPALERIRGRPYPDIVARVSDYLDRPPLAGQSELVVDATGVGRGVVDMVRATGLAPVALTITGGAKVTGTRRAPKVPKVDLVEGLLLAFQAGRIKIAAELPHAAVLARELTELRRKITAAGNTTYGVWRDGEHDDLILALAMALWQADRRRPVAGTVRTSILELGDTEPGNDCIRRHLADALR